MNESITLAARGMHLDVSEFMQRKQFNHNEDIRLPVGSYFVGIIPK